MNFFEAQDAARRRTLLLVGIFMAVIAAFVAVLYCVLYMVFYQGTDEGRLIGFDPKLLFYVTIAVTAILLGASLFKLLELRQGGSAVALSLGAIPMERLGLNDVRYIRLRNVVEEMTIASGCPQPAVFVLDEPSINAFAAGWLPEDAAIAVTRGALNYLTRDELQGVVAHEFSHIAHGDMRINCRMLALITGLFVFTILGRVLVQIGLHMGPVRVGFSSRRRDSGAGLALAFIFFGALLWILGWIGVIAGFIIQAAISRQREYLADASAVQYTRNPLGIAGALKKIGGLSVHSRIRHPRASEMAHFFFADIRPAFSNFLGVLSTHPPLEDRIRRLDPAWDGKFPRVVPVIEEEPLVSEEQVREVRNRWRTQAAAGLDAEYRVVARDIYESIGNPTEKDLAYARGLRSAWPAELLEATRDPYLARALIYALLLDPKPEVRARQLQHLQKAAAEGLAHETERLAKLLETVGRESWLPLAQLAVGSLTELSEDEWRRFRKNVAALIQADGRLSLFEYCLAQAVLAPLARRFGERPPKRREPTRAALPDIAIVVGTLARLGHRSEEEKAKAYRTAMQGTFPRQWLKDLEELPPKEKCTLAEFDKALKRLAGATIKARDLTLQAALRCVAYDDRITIPEAEALRAIAAVLGLPMPPVAARMGQLQTT